MLFTALPLGRASLHFPGAETTETLRESKFAIATHNSINYHACVGEKVLFYSIRYLKSRHIGEDVSVT